jgi:NAD-dependent deacetylase
MTEEYDPSDIQKACEIIKNARHTVALTGAGISTPSGIPDFRSQATGLWSKNDPMQVASLSAFRQKPQVFFNWLRPLAASMTHAEPNPAHLALAGLEKANFLKAVVTQNIDGLHQRAGSQNVIEVHGTMDTYTCPSCHRTYPEKDFRKPFLEENGLPTCPACGKLVKPDIVLYEEMLPEIAWLNAQHHFEESDLVLVIGSSLEVSPVNQLPYYGLEHGARLIIVNYSPTQLDSYADVLIAVDVAVALPKILAGVL